MVKTLQNKDKEKTIIIIKNRCVGCGCCLFICPVSCIIGKPGRLFLILSNNCIGCLRCASICKYKAVVQIGNIK